MPLNQNAVVHANFVGTLMQQTVMTGCWFQAITAGLDPEDLATALVPLATSIVAPASSVEVTWREVVVSDPAPDGLATYHASLGAGIPGTVAGDCLPPQCTVRTRLTTGFKSGRRRGSTLFPGLSEVGVQGGHLSGAQATAIETYHGGLFSQFGPSGSNPNFRWVIYSPENLTATPPRPGNIISPVTGHAQDTLVRTLHRRQIGIGI